MGRRLSVDCGTIWVCTCCMLSHANGECCPDEDHGGDGVAPWSAVDDRYRAYMGLSREEHDEGCVPYEGSGVECGCDRREFSSSSCDGCGSYLAGERFAFGLYREARFFRRMPLPA